MAAEMGNNRGFIMLNVIFLTLIVSFVAMIYLNGTATLTSGNSTLRLTALNLMNEQFAELESRAAQGNLSTGTMTFLGNKDDLTSYNANENLPTEFKISANVTERGENLFKVTVKVEWQFHGKDFEIKSAKTVRGKIE